MKIVIVVHGTEGVDRGGPTQRALALCRAAIEVGLEAIVLDDLQKLEREYPDFGQPDLVHVFNIWPFESAVKQLTLAKRIGAKTVFSPIALDLNFQPIYSDALRSLVQQASEPIHLEHIGKSILALTETKPEKTGLEQEFPKIPIEGVEGNFEFLRLAMHLADHLICLSKMEKVFLQSIGGTLPPVSIIQNGIDVDVMKRGIAGRFRQQYSLNKFILCVGRIEPRKNQLFLAQAARKLELPLVCIGHGGDNDYLQQLYRFAPSSFLHIHRLENREQLADAYAAASVFCLPSWAEGAPLSALEAAAAGTPLALSKMSGEREYFGEFSSYFHPANIEEMVEKITFSMREGSTENSQALSDFSLQRFDVTKHCASTIKLWKKLSKEPQSKPFPKSKIGILAVAEDREFTALSFVEQDNAMQISLHDLKATEDLCRRFVPPILAPSNVSTQGVTRYLEFVRKRGVKRSFISMFKQVLNVLPRKVHWPIVEAILKVSPQFNKVVEEQNRIFSTVLTHASTKLNSHIVVQKRFLPTFFSHLEYLILRTDTKNLVKTLYVVASVARPKQKIIVVLETGVLGAEKISDRAIFKSVDCWIISEEIIDDYRQSLSLLGVDEEKVKCMDKYQDINNLFS